MPILSYLSALNFMRNGKELIREGYHKACQCIFVYRLGFVVDFAFQFYNTTYKVPTLDSWLVIVSGPKMIDDVRRRPDGEMSFDAGVQEVCMRT